MRTDGRTDRERERETDRRIYKTKLIVALRNFANAPKNGKCGCKSIYVSKYRMALTGSVSNSGSLNQFCVHVCRIPSRFLKTCRKYRQHYLSLWEKCGFTTPISMKQLLAGNWWRSFTSNFTNISAYGKNVNWNPEVTYDTHCADLQGSCTSWQLCVKKFCTEFY